MSLPKIEPLMLVGQLVAHCSIWAPLSNPSLFQTSNCPPPPSSLIPAWHQIKRQRQIPKEMQRDHAFGRDLDGLCPELEFGPNGAMKHEVLWVGMERTDGRVMTDLLTDHAVAQLLPSHKITHAEHCLLPWSSLAQNLILLGKPNSFKVTELQ